MELPIESINNNEYENKKNDFLSKIKKPMNLLIFASILKLLYAFILILIFFILNLVEINTLEIILISFILFILFAYAIRTLRLSFKILAGDIRQLQFIIYFSYIFGLFLGSIAAYFLNKEYKLYLKNNI